MRSENLFTRISKIVVSQKTQAQLHFLPQLRRDSAVPANRRRGPCWPGSPYPSLLLASALLLCGCAAVTTAGEVRFRLERAKGTPVVDAGGDSYRMDWAGKLTYIWRRRGEAQEPHPERWEGASLDELPVPAEEEHPPAGARVGNTRLPIPRSASGMASLPGADGAAPGHRRRVPAAQADRSGWLSCSTCTRASGWRSST